MAMWTVATWLRPSSALRVSFLGVPGALLQLCRWGSEVLFSYFGQDEAPASNRIASRVALAAWMEGP